MLIKTSFIRICVTLLLVIVGAAAYADPFQLLFNQASQAHDEGNYEQFIISALGDPKLPSLIHTDLEYRFEKLSDFRRLQRPTERPRDQR